MCDEVADSLELQLCDIQGRLFELAQVDGCDCPSFVRTFMTSPIAAALDRPYDRTQWVGEEYLLEELLEDHGPFAASDETPLTSYSRESMYWMGYLYRYWHFYQHLSSADIYLRAPAERMHRVYPAYHTLDPRDAIDRLCERLG